MAVQSRDNEGRRVAGSSRGAFSIAATGGRIETEMSESTEEFGPEARITPRLIDALYTEAMILADEARAYFDEEGRDDRQSLEPFARVGFACESLKVTTRIMHIVAWLLTPRAVESGEIKSADGRRPERRLGHANDSDPTVVDQLPEAAKRLIGASVDLYSRVQRLDEGQMIDEPAQSPARALMGRLERDLIWNRNA
jgi:regulator of CtrA degradation